MRYLAEVVQTAIQEYAEDQRVSFLAVPQDADGPSALTVARWLAMAERSDIEAWMEQRLLAHSTVWRTKLLPEVEREFPRPDNARPFIWRVLQMARCLSGLDTATSSPLPVCFIQLAKLNLADRYAAIFR